MSNQAAWIQSSKQNPLVVDDAPTNRAGPDEVVIKNAYLAINPVDWKIQHYGIGLPIYPNILGRDIAGEVVEVGSNVARIKIGQRVIAYVRLNTLHFWSRK
jgi:NADPH:quinone reductase-like Zn-dependent oxidoreductase